MLNTQTTSDCVKSEERGDVAIQAASWIGTLRSPSNDDGFGVS
jgi:hypothetical protein